MRAVGIDFLTRLATGEVTADDLNNGASGSSTLADDIDRNLIDAAAVRTKFYDEFFLDSTKADIRQIVILASGLDSRAYRLPWPTRAVVYEVDQPQVIEFKTRTLADLGAVPAADRRVAGVDLRDDWPAALRTAGFDPAQKTAWSAEGLLGYLPPEAQDRLLDTITELSAPGSRVATESTPNPEPGRDEKTREQLQQLSERWSAHGFDPEMGGLAYFGERNEAAPYSADHGWKLIGVNIADLFATHGFQPIGDDDIRFGETLFVSGALQPDRR